MGYKLDLATAFKVKELLEAVDQLEGNRVITPEIFEVIKAAKELDNMKQFLTKTLGK